MGMQINNDTPRKIPNAIHKTFSDRRLGGGLGLICGGNVLVGTGFFGAKLISFTALALTEVFLTWFDIALIALL